MKNKHVLVVSFISLFVSALVHPIAQGQTLGMVVDDTNGNVIVFDADNDTVVGSVNVPGGGGNTLDCSILDDQSLGFVGDFFGGQVWVIDPSVPGLAAGTNPIAVSFAAEDTTLSADQQFLLSADGGGSVSVSVIDIAARAEIGFFDVGNTVESVEACSDNSVLTTGHGSSVVNRLTIDGAGNLTNTGETSGLTFAFNVACGPSGGNAVASQVNGASSSAQSYTYPPLTTASSTTLAFDGVTVLISPDGSSAYIRSTGSSNTVEGFTYNEATGALSAAPFVSFAVAPATMLYFGVDQMAIHPDGSKLYVTEGNALEVYDAATGNPLASITDAALVRGAGVCLPRPVVTHVRDIPAPTGDDIVLINIGVIQQVANEVVVAGTTDADFCVAPDIREIVQRNGKPRYISRPLRLPELAGLGTCTGQLVADDPETWEDLLGQVDLEIEPWYRSYLGEVKLPDGVTMLPDGSDPVGHWFVLGVVRTSAEFEGANVTTPLPEALIDYTGAGVFDPTVFDACRDGDLSLRPLDLGGIAFGEFPNPEVEIKRMIVDTAQCNAGRSLGRRTTHVYPVRLDGKARVERINIVWQLNGIQRTLTEISNAPPSTPPTAPPTAKVAAMELELISAREAFAEGRFDEAIFDLEELACIANSTDFSGIDLSVEANYSGALVARSIAGAFGIHDRFIHADASNPGWEIYRVPEGLGLPVLTFVDKASCPLP